MAKRGDILPPLRCASHSPGINSCHDPGLAEGLFQASKVCSGQLATDAGLDPAIFTAKTFRKSGIMAGIDAGVAIPRTYTDLIFDINESDTDHLRESTL